MRRSDLMLQWGVPAWIATLTVLTCLAILIYRQSEDGLRTAHANLHQCRLLAGQIKTLRSSESIALDQPVSAATVSNEMLRVSRQAGISEPQVQEIQHLPSTQIEKTDFRRDDTLLRFSGVNVKQLTKLLLQLENQEQSPTPSSLTLRTGGAGSSPSGGEETWTAELILTRLSFAAQSPSGSPVR